MGVLPTRTSRAAGLRSTHIFGLRELISGEIDHVIFGHGRWSIRLHTRDLRRQHNRRHQQSRLQYPGDQNSAVGEQAGMGFSRQRFARRPQGRAH
jgi:hypothetical protein